MHHDTRLAGLRPRPRKRRQSRACVDPQRPLSHDREPARAVARQRTARDRLRRPQQCRQVHGHQPAGAAEAPGLRLAHARAHPAHQPVRGGAEGRAGCALRRPARLRLCGGGTRRQAALAGGDGRLPAVAPLPARRGADDRFAAGLHRPRSPAARIAGAAPGRRPGATAGAAHQGRQAEPPRCPGGVAGGTGAVGRGGARGRRYRRHAVLGVVAPGPRRTWPKCCTAGPCRHDGGAAALRPDAAARHHPGLPRHRRRACAGAAAARLPRGGFRVGRSHAAAGTAGGLRGTQPAGLSGLVGAGRRRGVPRPPPGGRYRRGDRGPGRAGRPAGGARLGRCPGLGPGGAAAGTDAQAAHRQCAASGRLPARAARQPRAALGQRLHEFPLPARRREAAGRTRLRAAVAVLRGDAGLAHAGSARTVPGELEHGFDRPVELLPRFAVAAGHRAGRCAAAPWPGPTMR